MRIVVQGELVHNNAVTLRANVAPHLVGNFFTVGCAREAFEQVPWVRRAQVRRVYPGSLRVELQDDAVAYWGPDTGSALVNSQGEVFEANVGDVGKERPAAPAGASRQLGRGAADVRAAGAGVPTAWAGCGRAGADRAGRLARHPDNGLWWSQAAARRRKWCSARSGLTANPHPGGRAVRPPRGCAGIRQTCATPGATLPAGRDHGECRRNRRGRAQEVMA